MRDLYSFASKEFRDIYTDFSASVKKERTSDEYTSYINLMCRFLETDFLSIDSAGAKLYISHLKGQCSLGKLSYHTVCVRLSCYKTVASYIENTDRIDGYISPFRGIKRPDIISNEVSSVRIPSIQEMNLFAEEIKGNLMLYLIFSLASRVGMSVTDIVSIRKDMLYDENGRMCIIYPAKNVFSEPRIIPLPSDVRTLMCNYLSRVVPDSAGHIFFNERGRKLTIRNVDFYFERAYKNSSLTKRYTLKDFRSRAMLDLAEANISAEKICDYTGLSMMRALSYVKSTHIIHGECAADLTNYKLNVSDETAAG